MNNENYFVDIKVGQWINEKGAKFIIAVSDLFELIKRLPHCRKMKAKKLIRSHWLSIFWTIILLLNFDFYDDKKEVFLISINLKSNFWQE